LLAKDNITITSDLDGMVKIWDISTGHCKESFQTHAKGSYHGDIQLIHDSLIFAWNTEDQIIIWDLWKRKHLLKVNHSQSNIDDLGCQGMDPESSP
jgi:WD40 repeat protein